MESRIIIGIDPGKNTGYAVWDSLRGEFLEIQTLSITEAIERTLGWYARESGKIRLIYEDARQRKWYGDVSPKQERSKLQGVGSVKRDCSIWEDFCKEHHIPAMAKKPQAGTTKWDEERFRTLTGWKGRTSEHARDAALLVWGR